jgi:hypothetical protein
MDLMVSAEAPRSILFQDAVENLFNFSTAGKSDYDGTLLRSLLFCKNCFP